MKNWATSSDRLANLHAVFGMHKGHIIDDEYAGFANLSQLRGHNLGTDAAIGAAIKRPSAAESAVPRTATREFDRCAGIECADEIFAPMPQQIAGRTDFVEALHKAGRGSFALLRDHARHTE